MTYEATIVVSRSLGGEKGGENGKTIPQTKNTKREDLVLRKLGDFQDSEKEKGIRLVLGNTLALSDSSRNGSYVFPREIFRGRKNRNFAL